MLIVFGGLPGTGKTTISRALTTLQSASYQARLVAPNRASTHGRSMAKGNGRLPPIAKAAGLSVSRSSLVYLIADEIPSEKYAAALRRVIPRQQPRSSTHKPHPDPCGGKFYKREVVGVVLFEAGCNRSGMLEFAEEALDEVPVMVKPRAEHGNVHPSRHWLDVGPSTTAGHGSPDGIAIVGSVGKKDLAVAQAVEHVGCATSVVSLPFAQLDRNWVAVGIHDGMDFGCQPASRAPHACGWSDVPNGGSRRAPFLTLAAC